MIYLDNAATSYPKPMQVARSMYSCVKNCYGSYGRGAHAGSMQAMDIVFKARSMLANILHVDHAENIVMTNNATMALNIAICGMVGRDDHVITTHLEHNSVMRPLIAQKASVSYLPQNEDGSSNIAALNKYILPQTKLVIINHASNVSGLINDIYLAGEICAKFGAPLLIDASQTMGVIPVDAGRLNGMVAFPGHKGLMGPQGSGGLYIPPGYALSPVISGGTGSLSESFDQPEQLPDRFESGTIGIPAIAGLISGMQHIQDSDMKNIYTYEMILCSKLIAGLKEIPGVSILLSDNMRRVPTVSFNIDGKDCSAASEILSEQHEICTRSGLHCAPAAHKAYGTFETGTLRLSPGYFNTTEEIETALRAVREIART